MASPGCLLVAADYSQVELRVLAHLSGDTKLIQILRQAGVGGDAFALIAKTWLRKPHDTGHTCLGFFAFHLTIFNSEAAKRAEPVVSNGHTCLQACLSANPFYGSVIVGSSLGGNTQFT